MCGCVRAHLLAGLDRRADAGDAFEQLAGEGFAALPRNDEWVFAVALLADVASYLGDAARGELLYELLLPYEDRNAVSAPDACIGAVGRSLGVLAALLGRSDDAARHFDAALAMNARTGALPWLAQTQYDYARMLLDRDGPGDREHGLELLAGCAETARELGMTRLKERTNTLREEAFERG